MGGACNSSHSPDSAGRPKLSSSQRADQRAEEGRAFKLEKLKERLYKGTGNQAKDPTRYYSDPTDYDTLQNRQASDYDPTGYGGRRLASAEPDRLETFTASEVVGITILVVLLYMMFQALKCRMGSNPHSDGVRSSKTRCNSAVPTRPSSRINDKKL